MTRTHTLAELVLSQVAYDEIRKSFEAAGYQHAPGADGMIDMTGVGVTRLPGPSVPRSRDTVMVTERTTIIQADGTTSTRFRRNFGRNA